MWASAVSPTGFEERRSIQSACNCEAVAALSRALNAASRLATLARAAVDRRRAPRPARSMVLLGRDRAAADRRRAPRRSMVHSWDEFGLRIK